MKVFSKYMMLSIFGMSLLFSSCYKDLSNTDYVEVSEVTISIPALVDGAYACDPDSHVVLESKLEFMNDSKESDYDYEWVLIPKSLGFDNDNGFEHKIVISTEKNLDFVATQAARDYTMFYNVINKETKLKCSFNFSFSISMIKGWMVLDENAAGEGDVSIIYNKALVPEYPESKSGVVMNYFSNSNNIKLTNGLFLSKRTHSANDHVYVFCKDGGYRVKSGTGLIDQADYGKLFLSPPAVKAPQAHFYPNGMNSKMEILVNNEEVYIVKWNMMGAKPTYTTPLATSESKLAKALPIIAPIFPISGMTSTAVLYNPYGTGNFFQISTNGGYKRMADAVGPFNPANINPTAATDYQLVYMDRGKDDLTYALMKDSKQNGGSNLWLFKADFRADPVEGATIAKEKTDLSAYPGILAAKYFAIGLRGEYMYYADDTQVTHTPLNGATTPIFTAPAGDKIVFMKLYTLYNAENSGKFLFIATYNETSQKGIVHMAELETIGGKLEPGKLIVEYPGFNRVKDMYLKN